MKIICVLKLKNIGKHKHIKNSVFGGELIAAFVPNIFILDGKELLERKEFFPGRG